MTLPDPNLPWPICMAAVALIAEAERCRLKAYRCPAGVWTCGWGETADVTPTTAWAQDWADRRFCESLTLRTEQVKAMCTEHPSTDQLGALVSLSYNIGCKGLAGSTVLKAHNRGDFEAAARAFSLWNKARVNGTLRVLNGLTARRAAEAALYLRPDADEPKQAMPQAVAPESSLAASPIAQSGAATAGAGVLALLSQTGDQVQAFSGTATTVKSFAADTLGIPAPFVLPGALVLLGAVVVWQRLKQRACGWA